MLSWQAQCTPLYGIVLGDLVLDTHVLHALAPLGHPVARPVEHHVEVHACTAVQNSSNVWLLRYDKHVHKMSFRRRCLATL